MAGVVYEEGAVVGVFRSLAVGVALDEAALQLARDVPGHGLVYAVVARVEVADAGCAAL